eukprot:6487794-Amphidinium_carterae.1
MSLDGSADYVRTAHTGGRDPPPAWSGDDPLKWRQTRRDLLLWANDSDTPASRQGTRFFRSLSGRARQLCDGLEDQLIMAPDGLMYIINHLDALYKGSLSVAKELEGEKALFSGHRTADENMVAYISRRQVELSRYETALGERLPEALKTKLIVRQAKLNTQQGHLLSTWTNGSRDLQVVLAALCRLDTERELLGLSLGSTAQSKDMFEEEEPEPPESFVQSPSWSAEADELVQFYEEAHDVGEDSDAEDFVWILASDLQYELDEQVLDQQLASFSQVQKQKNMLKKARGWFAPDTWKGGKGSEKGKPTKGLSTSTNSHPPSGKSGKGLSKGKGSKTKGKYDLARQQRDERRVGQGLQRMHKSDLSRAVRCWRCGQLGHLSRNCPSASAPSTSTTAHAAPRNFF